MIEGWRGALRRPQLHSLERLLILLLLLLMLLIFLLLPLLKIM